MMNLPLTLMLLGSALGTAPLLPAQAQTLPQIHARPVDGLAAPDMAARLVLVSDDEGDDGWQRGGDDDSSGDDCSGEDRGDGDCRNGGRGNAAPAGAVAPPANGLFGTGKAPQASTN